VKYIKVEKPLGTFETIHNACRKRDDKGPKVEVAGVVSGVHSMVKDGGQRLRADTCKNRGPGAHLGGREKKWRDWSIEKKGGGHGRRRQARKKKRKAG